jgi:hypothetical protein
VAENTAKHSGGAYIRERYYGWLHPQTVDTRSGDEIIAYMQNKLDKLGGEA